MRMEEYVTDRRKGCRRYGNVMEGKRSRKYVEITPMGIAAGITLWGIMEGIEMKLVEKLI
jgi:hypothetical protein